MTDHDLAAELTRAFQAQADTVTSQVVRHRAVRPSDGRGLRPGRLRAGLVAAACVVAVVVAVVAGVATARVFWTGGLVTAPPATTSPRLSSSSAPWSSGSGRGYVGQAWRLEDVLRGGQFVTVPDDLVATLQLSTDGRLVMFDTVNWLSGRYTVTDAGFTASQVQSTFKGYFGGDPFRTAVVGGMGAVAGEVPAAASSSASTEGARPAVGTPPGVVVARVEGARLVLETGGYRLTFGPSATGSARPGPARSTGSAALTSACRAVQLQPGLLPLSGQTGEHGTVVTLLNRSATACTLTGHPGVELLDAAVLPFQIRYSTGHYVTANRPDLVRLTPGSTAYVVVAKYRCDLGSDRTATSLRLTLPGDDSAVTVPALSPFDHCTGQDPDPGNTVEVSPIGSALADLGSIPK